MKKLYIILLFYVIGGASGFSQEDIPAQDQVLNNTEEVFVHYNSTFLLAGENLFYKFYCISPYSGKLSNLSSIGYLELIGQDGKQLFLHKVDLESGAGYGDFLIPSTVPSGAYKLLAYTRWMQNSGKEHFFSGDLVIINPYMEDQSNVLRVNDSAEVNNITPLQQDSSLGDGLNENKRYSLELDKVTFRKRENVTLHLNQSNSGTSKGNFSVSVKKLENFSIPPATTAERFQTAYPASNWNFYSKLVLPDLRGEIISGRIIPQNENLETGGRTVIFSLPGESFFIRMAKTARDGSFKFNLDKRNFGSQAYLQVLGENKEHFEIILDGPPAVEKQNLEFIDARINPEMVELIRQRSIYNQVENSFVSVKQDSIHSQAASIPFYGSLPEVYNLDEFTRFPTLQETFVEIIQRARVRSNRDGSSYFDLISSAGSQSFKPLLIVDGLIVQNHEDFVNYDAGKIKSIGLQREEYYLGPEVFKGLLVVETIDGNFFELVNHQYLNSTKIQNLRPKKTYFQPPYDTEKYLYSRVPDYRLQLLWLPNLDNLNSTEYIDFFTSDVPGNYEITIEGFTEDGDGVSLKKVINVQ